MADSVNLYICGVKIHFQLILLKCLKYRLIKKTFHTNVPHFMWTWLQTSTL